MLHRMQPESQPESQPDSKPEPERARSHVFSLHFVSLDAPCGWLIGGREGGGGFLAIATRHANPLKNVNICVSYAHASYYSLPPSSHCKCVPRKGSAAGRGTNPNQDEVQPTGSWPSQFALRSSAPRYATSPFFARLRQPGLLKCLTALTK